MEARTEKRTLTLTPTEADAVDYLARALGQSRSEVLRNDTVAGIVRRAGEIRAAA